MIIIIIINNIFNIIFNNNNNNNNEKFFSSDAEVTLVLVVIIHLHLINTSNISVEVNKTLLTEVLAAESRTGCPTKVCHIKCDPPCPGSVLIRVFICFWPLKKMRGTFTMCCSTRPCTRHDSSRDIIEKRVM